MQTKNGPTWGQIVKTMTADVYPIRLPSGRQLIAALRDVLDLQARQIEHLRERVRSLETTRNPEGWEEDWPSS
jgi:hypothetical protein